MRINLLNPIYLTDQHLIAEYREILMATKSLERNVNSGAPIPENFTLGKGHITFFKNKISYLKSRHKALIAEMRKRGFRANHKIHTEVFPTWCTKRYWEPSRDDKKIIASRILDRLVMKPEWYRYYGKHLTMGEYVDLTYNGVHDHTL